MRGEGFISQAIIIQNAVISHETQEILAELLIIDGKIAAPGTAPPAEARLFDAEGRYLLPGFLDLHTHGAIGVDFNDITIESLRKAGRFFASQGVTGFLPTTLTDTKEKLLECIHVICAAMAEPYNGAEILGIHLEGPYLAAEYKGAMPEHLLRLPSVAELTELQHAAKGAIRRITVSPELPGMVEFVRLAADMGIAVSLGHSGAGYDRTWSCIHAGAVSATHIFNAMKPLHHHTPDILGALLESDLICEMICDGLHLHPGIVRLLIQTKGLDHLIAVTDSTMAAGLGDGSFKIGANDIVVTDGDARLADGSARAGSTLTMIRALRNLLHFTGLPLSEVSPLLSANPARMIGLERKKGSLLPGMAADLVLLDRKLQVMATIVGGVIVYQK